MEFGDIADDIFVNFNLQTTLKLPSHRETVLHFFESIQKEFVTMTNFFQRDGGEYVLEDDREQGSYRWCELHPHRFCGGFFNPPSLAAAYRFHDFLLQRSIYYLGVGGLDVDAMGLLYGFNLDYMGNRDAIVADALIADSPLAGMMDEEHFRPIECEPNITFALDEDCYLQGRISVESRCNSYQIRTGQFDEEPISVYFTIQRYPQPGKVLDLREDYAHQCRLGEDLTHRIVIPQIVQRISETIVAGS